MKDPTDRKIHIFGFSGKRINRIMDDGHIEEKNTQRKHYTKGMKKSKVRDWFGMQNFIRHVIFCQTLTSAR